MFCSNCGKQLAEGAMFCDACGTRVQAPSDAPGRQYAQSGYAQPEYARAKTVTLNSIPAFTVNAGEICMFGVKDLRIEMEMESAWGAKSFTYFSEKDMYNDCGILFEAIKECTNNMVFQFRSEGRPVVALNRVTFVYLNEWWKRIELDISGAGKKWFQYPDKDSLMHDYGMLMEAMSRGRRS